MSDITDTTPAAEAEQIEAVETVETRAGEGVDAIAEPTPTGETDGAVEAEAIDDGDAVEAEAIDDGGAVEAEAIDDGGAVEAEATDDGGVVEAGTEAGGGSAEDAGDRSEAEAEETRPRRRRDSPYDRPGRWYVIHTQSGYENKVRSNLLARTQSMNMEERIFEVVIPLEDVVEFKNGKKVVVQKKVFPGYLLTRMHLDDDSWFVVRNTPGVTGFIGAGNKPSPLPRKDVETFLVVKEDGDEPSRKGRPRLEYTMGETVRVKEGPFADFQGEIVEINEDQLRLKVLVNIFGRETPVELQFAEVAKI